MKKLLTTLIGFTAIFFSGCTGSKDPVSVSKDFWKNVSEGKVEVAMELVSDEKIKSVLGKAYAQPEFQEEFKKNPVVSIDVIDKKETGDQAEVKIELTQKNKTEKKIAMRFGLFKNDGIWKINKVFTN